MRLFKRLPVITLIFGLSLLAGCSSGGGDGGVSNGTTSFTVSTSAGADGSISPASTSVNQNGTASFTVTPDAGFQIDTVSGCGGSLTGRTYTTGAITADCTVSASFVIQRVTKTLNPVAELLSNAANWNDYAPGSDWSTASNSTCTAATDIACIHGGEHRMVLVTGKTDCTGLSASDGLGVFNWVCDASLGTARMISTGLADGKYLSDLVNFDIANPRFRNNAVTVSDSIGVWGSTPSTNWWPNNPVVINNTGGILNNADPTISTIHLVTSDPGISWQLRADKLAVVVQPGVALTASSFVSVALGNVADYLWLEGTINATGRLKGVILAAVRFSVLNNVISNNAHAGLASISLENASKNRLIDVTASNNGSDGISLDNASSFNTLTGVTTDNNGAKGVFLDNASNNILTGVSASNNGSNGISFDNASFNMLSGLTANNNGTYGIYVDNTSNNNTLSGVAASNNIDGVFINNASFNTLTEVTASTNSFSGVRLGTGSSNNTLLVVTASNNAIGVDLFAAVNNTLAGVTVNSNGTGVNVRSASNSNTVIGVTASNNGGYGVNLDTSSNNTLLGVTASNNNFGVNLYQSSSNTLSDLASSNNNEGITVFSGSNNNTFTGWLEVGSNSAWNCFAGLSTEPGLVNSTCAPNGTSDHTLVTGIDLTNAFVAKVLIDDVLNADDTNGTAANFPADPAAFDWTNFDNGFRGWGVDGPAFPSASQRGQWTIGGGRIWDWSVSIGDNGNAGNPALLNVLTLPSGSDTLTHTWSDMTTTTFLRNAVELPADGVGNDNTLCESSETCIYLPNIGSYQGHGDFVNAGMFVDGSLTGITLIKYEMNGR